MCSIRTLIADDDPGALQLLKDVLSSAGYRVHQAPSGREAVQTVRQHRVGVAIGMADLLRETPLELRIGAENRQMSLDAGCTAQRTKPIKETDPLAAAKDYALKGGLMNRTASREVLHKTGGNHVSIS